MILVLGATLNFFFGTKQYIDNPAWGTTLVYGPTTDLDYPVTPYFNATGWPEGAAGPNQIMFLIPIQTNDAPSNYDNQPLVLMNLGGNPTGGDGTMTVNVVYCIVPTV